ncbi:MAG: restriction endonuclease subunit S [Cellvibrionaceae bacterium]
MNSQWPLVRLGDLLSSSKYAADILPDEEYKEVTVRLWGKGVNLRGVKLGSEIGTGKRFYVSPGQFILSKIDARHGAFGVIPEELDGAVITSDFPLFEADPKRLDVEYLNWLSKTPWFVDACKKVSEGTTNRVRLKEKQFLGIEIRLPELAEQRQIVKKIESIRTQVNEVTSLRKGVLTEAQALLQSAFQNLIDDVQYLPMSQVLPIIRRKVSVNFDGEYPELGVRSFGKGTFHKPALNGVDVGSKKLYHIEPNDLVLSNVFAWEGAIAVAQPTDTGRVGSHRFITCVPEEGVVTSDFICFYLLTQEGIEKVREASPGGAGRNRTLGLKKLEKIEVPIPDFGKQLWFNQLQQKVADIKQAQLSNAVELEALMPSILDKAFRGELV